MHNDEIDHSRRAALLLAAGGASLGIGVSSAIAADTVNPVEANFSRTPPSSVVEIGPLVPGQYELTYTEGYAQGLLALGFSSAAVTSALTNVSAHVSYKVDGRSLLLSDGWVGNTLVALGQPKSVTILGARIDDWILYFDRPDRLITSFTSPNNQKVWSIRRFSDAGIINTTAIGNDPKVASTRVWRRVAEKPGIAGVQLL